MKKNTAITAAEEVSGVDDGERIADSQIDLSAISVEDFLKTCKKVPVRLPLADPNDKVVEVGFNGFMMLIKRGETVEVPEPIYEILLRSGRFF